MGSTLRRHRRPVPTRMRHTPLRPRHACPSRPAPPAGLLDAWPVAAWIEEPGSGRIVTVNDAALALYGYARAAFLTLRGEDLEADGCPTDAPPAPATVVGAAPARRRHRAADGTLRHVVLHERRIEHDGLPWRLVCAEDHGAEQQMQQALQDSNLALQSTMQRRSELLRERDRHTQALVALSPQIIWQMDRQGYMVYLSPAWERLVGERPGDWLGPRWAEALHPDDRDDTMQALALAFARDEPLRMVRRLRAANGEYRTLLCVGAPVPADGGRPRIWTGVDTDITEVDRRTLRWHQADQDIEAFSYAVSHDLRGPLQVVRGFTDALLQARIGQVDDAALGYLRRIDRQAQRMDRLIGDLLQLTRLARGPLQHEAVSLPALLKTVVQRIRERHAGHDPRLALPSYGVVQADAGLLELAMTHLLDNAFRFTATCAAPTISVDLVEGPDSLLIRVSDNGIGFPVSQSHKLFRPFQRLHADRAGSGSGTGLAAVARIAHRHGGSVHGENRAQGGACFSLRLPRVPHHMPAPIETETSHP